MQGRGNQGAWTPVARAQGLGSRGTGGWLGLRTRPAPCPQVEMLYEEALYTVLYRAGTMGPDQVDDQETLLGYLQQVSPTGSALPAGPAPPSSGENGDDCPSQPCPLPGESPSPE